MDKSREGSIVVVMLGLFWLVGIMTAVLYMMVNQVSTLAELREVQTRYWYALEGGMMTAIAHLKDNPEVYAQSGSHTLYAGAWPVDHRHPTLHLTLTLERGDEKGDRYRLTGTLLDEGTPRISVAWFIRFDEQGRRFVYEWGERTCLG